MDRRAGVDNDQRGLLQPRGCQPRAWRGNEKLVSYGWHHSRYLRDMAPRVLDGMADPMGWEILLKTDGFAIDADSVCVRPLDHWRLEHEAFACWDRVLTRLSLIAAGHVACQPGKGFFGRIIKDVQAEPGVIHDVACITGGPQRATDNYRHGRTSSLTVLPSLHRSCKHFTVIRYQGQEPTSPAQRRGSTRRNRNTVRKLARTASAIGLCRRGAFLGGWVGRP